MARILLAGESWIRSTIDHKGFDPFPHTAYQIGCEKLVKDLTRLGDQVFHLPGHLVPTEFPRTREELTEFDAVILSDIGSDSLLLSPRVFEAGLPDVNRLELLSEWVKSGGSLMMAGGYLSFQGYQGKANYHGTPIEEILPVELQPFDDRVEKPEGVSGYVVDHHHPIVAGIDDHWPPLLGYQKLTLRSDAFLIAAVEGNPLLAVRNVGEGRTLAFASDISPHWAGHEFMEWPGYATLFHQSVKWLAGK